MGLEISEQNKSLLKGKIETVRGEIRSISEFSHQNLIQKDSVSAVLLSGLVTILLVSLFSNPFMFTVADRVAIFALVLCFTGLFLVVLGYQWSDDLFRKESKLHEDWFLFAHRAINGEVESISEADDGRKKSYDLLSVIESLNKRNSTLNKAVTGVTLGSLTLTVVTLLLVATGH